MDKAVEIERIIAPSLEAMGYALVRVRIGGGQRLVLQVMAERLDEAPMSIADCTEISRAISALLDVEDPIAGSYTLEVSSPGIDRPLTRPVDYQRFAGREASLELRAPVEGRRRFRGRLVGLEGDRVRVATEEGEAVLPLGEIQRAKLVLAEAAGSASAKRRNR